MKKMYIGLFFVLTIILIILFFFLFNTKKSPPEVIRVSESKAAAPAKDHTRVYEYRDGSYPAAPASPDHTSASKPDKGIAESLLKYVLFSVKYDSKMNAGETKSLQLTMSPRNELRNLEKAVQDKRMQQNQINDIEKVQSQYKYISAELIAQNNCLQIQKKMPEEDKVYLPTINEAAGDQVWQWDLTASQAPLTSVCHLSLFIRFCMNQNDCVPMANPDKEFNIFIEITLGHKIYTWLSNVGNLASIISSILVLIGIIAGWKIWKRDQTKKNI